MFQHVRNAARAESHGFNAAGFDIAFVDNGGAQVASHVDCAGGNQIEAPGYAAQHRQRAVGKQLFRIDIGDAGLGGVIENLGQVRTGTALFINRGVQFVDDNAGDAGVFAAAEAAARQLNALFHLLRGVVAQGHNEDDFGVQGFGDFVVQGLGELVFTRRHQAFDQHHFGVFAARVVVGDDLFHQHVLLIARKQRLNVAHAQRFGRRDGGVSTHDAGGLVWRIAAGTRLGDRLEDAKANAFLFHSADHTEADAGQADAGSGRDQHNSTGHGITSFVFASGSLARLRKQHRQRSAGGGRIRLSGGMHPER